MKNTHRINGLIYITSGDEIKDCHVVNIHTSEVYFLKGYYGMQPNTKKIILTNDPILIADGIQSIEPDAVKWLNDNSSCEEVEIDNRPKISSFEKGFVMGNPNYNKIIIAKHQTIENRSNYSISLNEVYETKEIEEEAEIKKLLEKAFQAGWNKNQWPLAMPDFEKWYNKIKQEQQC